MLTTRGGVGAPLITTTNNLPHQLSSFIGRELEIAEVRRLVASARLITLTGVGGVGKTRLALQVAGSLLTEFENGVWFVDFSPLSAPALVPQVVAATLGLTEQADRPSLDTLAGYLCPRQALILLDNCEHLVGACAQLAEHLLQACPQLRIVSTSREALGIRGEMVWPVPSLQTPERTAALTLTPEQLMAHESVRLFVERARAAKPHFSLTAANSMAVAQICSRLDGIPLAIELAAARINLLPAEQILSRLDDRFRLLTGGSRTVLPRQQTLRALIDWSYDLLAEPERVLLRRLSVFAGGWTLEAAEEIAKDDGGRMKAEELLHPSSFILPPSSFILPPSSFILFPSAKLIEGPSSGIAHRIAKLFLDAQQLVVLRQTVGAGQ